MKRPRKPRRRALWVGMENDLAAYVADQRRPPPAPASPDDVARGEWERFHHSGDFLPGWWNDRAERERRFQAEKGAYLRHATPAQSDR